MAMRSLSLLEGRVLGALVEKAHTVPDSYPLSLNSLVAACNQKTARDPVINATEAEVQVAADALKGLSLAFESSGTRVSRYEHNMGRVFGVPSQSVALLATLLLRGPQTSAELRSTTERLHRFADVSSVDGFLEELATRADDKGGPLVVKLPRAPGAREARWTHLLSGPVDLSSFASAAGRPDAGDVDFVAASEMAAMRLEQGALRAEVSELRALVDRLYIELGVSRDDTAGTT
ncbi:MAG: hypothetical protein JWQ11_841 [Rhizobacter sp.]|nr:hypothetical protein [Rhizobacter sp.]